jgi:hypothetical protein
MLIMNLGLVLGHMLIARGMRLVDDVVSKYGAVLLGAMAQPTRLVAIACTMSDGSLSAWLPEVTTSDSTESALK